jgi:tripartite-type tricarboxylate transporter receptor subunit TctC
MAQPVVERLNRELLRVAALPEVPARLLELGVETAGGAPDRLQGLMQEEIARYSRIVVDARIERL